MPQLTLVDVPHTSRVRAVAPAADVVASAARVPAHVRMGTSSWSFPGWGGAGACLYDGVYDERTLANEGLHAYAQHPLMRTVGVDRGHYTPISVDTHRDLAAQVPNDFRFLVKAHDELTLPRLHQRHGARDGEVNARFLDASYARDVVVQPFVEGLGAKCGVLLFQFAQLSPSALASVGGAEALVDKLYRFLAALPAHSGYEVAVELRNPELVDATIAPRVKGALFAAGAVPCFGMRTGMPSLHEQARAWLPAQPSALIVRWLLKDGLVWDDAERAFFPYDKIVDEDPHGRAAIVELTERLKVPTVIIANNKAEGCSVRTLELLARKFA